MTRWERFERLTIHMVDMGAVLFPWILLAILLATIVARVFA